MSSKLLQFFLILLLLCFSSNTFFANVFPHNIRITQPDSEFIFDGNFNDGSLAAIRFTLSDNADNITVNILNENSEIVRSIQATNFSMGDTLVIWDGKDDLAADVPGGNYNVSIKTSSAGYTEYTVLANIEVGIFTRGVTSMKSTEVKNFGFVYSASGGGYAAGVTRHTNDLAQWGDTKGDATLTVTYDGDIGTVGSDNLRYSSEAHSDGFVYLARRSGTVPGIYRYHVDELEISLIDSGGYNGSPQGISLKGDGTDKYVAVSNASGEVYGFNLGENETWFQAKESLLIDSTAIFWDITFGRNDMLYATYYAPDTSYLPGVAAFNLANYSGAALTLADADWTVEGPDTATGNTITYYFAEDPNDDKVYFTLARRPNVANVQGIYAVKNLTTTPERELVFLDPEDNMTQFRADISVDPAGNIVFFENSNEFTTLISPPTGFNEFEYFDQFTTIRVIETTPIADVRVDADGNFEPDNDGLEFTILGVVTSVNLQANSNDLGIYVQDGTAGIFVFANNDDSSSYAIGTLLQITGTVDQFNGLTELVVENSGENIVDLGAGTVPSPIELYVDEWLSNGEMYEGSLIKISAAASMEGATWPAGSSGNYDMWDGFRDFTVRIDSDTDLDDNPEPTSPISLVGIAGQFDSSEPFDEGYQILPQMYSDIQQDLQVPPTPYFFMTSPEEGAEIEITSPEQTIAIAWEPTVDLNDDPVIYQFLLLPDVAQLLSDNDGAETTLTLSGQDILNLMGGAESVTLDWTVRTTDQTTDLIVSVDTNTVTFTDKVTDVEDLVTIPTEFFVDQNYPNPFNPTTTIQFGLPEAADVDLRIYDILGREVAVLINSRSMNAGYHTAIFNANALASGHYIYKLTTGKKTEIKKMLLLK